jgi:transposase
MTAGHEGNRHAGLGSLSHRGELLLQRISPAALDSREDFDSIGTVRHRHMTRRSVMDSPCIFRHRGSTNQKAGTIMISRVGIDIAKAVFEVHGVDERGHQKLSKTLRRSAVRSFFAQLPPCVVAMEACATSHYWGRELVKLGHEVRLMASQFVLPYRKGGKNDANDAEAICEAGGRPNMHFVALKTARQQSVLMVHRARTLSVAHRTAQVNQIRGLLGEFGIIVPKGVPRLRNEMPRILEDADNGLPPLAREILFQLLEQFRQIDVHVEAYDRKILDLAKADEAACRLMKIEAIGPQTATALIASIGDARVYHSGRSFAAALGMTPRQHSSGGKARLGKITRMGDRYLRTLLVHGARAYLRVVGPKTDAKSVWVKQLQQRRHVNIAAVALAAKNARIAWAILAHGTEYRKPSDTAAAAAA